MADRKQPGGEPNSPPPAYNPDPPPGSYPQANYPQANYPPAQGGQPVVYTSQPGYAPSAVVVQPVGPQPGSTFRYSTIPALVVCQHCNATVTTSITHETGLLTWSAAGVICLFMCWLGCCLIPFCVDACKDVSHSCPNCNRLVGKFRQFH